MSNIRVCLIVYHFPLRSQTFITRLVDILMAQPNLDVYVLVLGRGTERDWGKLKTDVKTLESRIKYAPKVVFDGPFLYPSRFKTIFTCFCHAPILTLRSLNVIRYGERARRLHVLRLAFAIKKLPPMDVYHAQFLTFANDLLACKRFGLFSTSTKIMCSVRGADISTSGSVSNQVLKELLYARVHLLPVSNSLYNLLSNRGYPENLISVVPSGVPDAEFSFLDKYDKNKNGHVINLLFIGRIVKKKGLDLAIRAVDRLVKGGISCTLTVLGDGPDRETNESLARSLSCDQNVFFRGEIDFSYVQNELAGADVLVVPSVTGFDGNMEGIPNVIKEAMLTGTIVVASRHSGIPELVKDGTTGFLFREGDIDDFVDTLHRANASRTKWQRIASTAYTVVKKTHGEDVMVKRLIESYKQAPSCDIVVPSDSGKTESRPQEVTRWHKGDIVPNKGKIVATKNLLGFRETILGRYHRDTEMQLLTFADGSRAKAIVDKQYFDICRESRTQRAERFLRLVEPHALVPTVLYSDPSRLIVEYFDGSPLNGSMLTPNIVIQLARYLAHGQIPYEPADEVKKPIVDVMRRARVGSHLTTFVNKMEENIYKNKYHPQGICFSDSSLKNFVLTEKGELGYIDVFGINNKIIGLVFIKQTLRIPRLYRKIFFDKFLELSPLSEHIKNNIGIYCALHFAERAAVRSPETLRRHVMETFYRERRRVSAYKQAISRLENCLPLINDNDKITEWLMSLGKMK